MGDENKNSAMISLELQMGTENVLKMMSLLVEREQAFAKLRKAKYEDKEKNTWK